MTSTLDVFNSQSALSPAGTGAAATHDLTVLMTVTATGIFIVVMGLIWAAWRSSTAPSAWWIWVGGVVVPVVTLTALFVGSTLTLQALTRSDDNALVIEVTGRQFWWDVTYDPQGVALRDANEVIVPVGRPVTLRLVSADVIHSFWVPSIAGKMDMIPGRVNELTVTATKAGRFRGQCAEFCGLSHPLMAFEMVALPPDDFDRWLRDLADEARDAATPALLAGRHVFLTAGCAACHSIRGVATKGRLGPDLTRVGARASLGAGMWRMNIGNLTGWIADVGDMKPGAQMPSYNHLSGPDLRHVAAWLESLK